MDKNFTLETKLKIKPKVSDILYTPYNTKSTLNVKLFINN